MSIVLHADMYYINNDDSLSYQGPRYLHFSSFDTDDLTVNNSDVDSWAGVVNIMHCSPKCTMFFNRWFMSSPTALSNFGYQYYDPGYEIPTVLANGYKGIQYKILNDSYPQDQRERVIRITATYEDTHSGDIGSIRTVLAYQFKLNGTIKYEHSAMTYATQARTIPSSATNVYREANGWSLPWLGKYRGNEIVGRFYYNTNYEFNQLTQTTGEAHLYCQIYADESTSVVNKFKEWLNGLDIEDEDDEDPYPDPDDPDDDDTDNPDPDPLPGISAVGTGFATLFTPSLAQLRNLSTRFWNATIIDFFQNLVENIENMFLSLAMVPFTVPAGRTVSVNFLGLFDTGISLTLAAQQFIEFNMGSIDLGNNSKIWKSNSALDYSPFSKLSIYLPFIGARELDIDDCRGKVINLKYRIDILSGECVALINVGGSTIYQFSGNCLTQIPITHENMRGLVSDAIMVATTFATGATSTGAAIAEESAAVAGAESTAELASEGWKLGNKITRNVSALASTTANAVLGGKPSYTKSGSISGACGFLAVRQPYLYLTTPISAIPNYYRRYSGYPCNRTVRLSQLSGFTVVESIRLNNLVATAPEVAEIYDLLKEGVII